MITLIARLQAKPGRGKDLAAACLEMAEKVRAGEPGCTLYVPYCALENENEIVFVEKYKTRKDLDEHRETPYYLEIVRERIAGMLAGPPEVEVFE